MLAQGSRIFVTIRFSEQEDRVDAFCDELGVATWGETLEEAQEQIAEAIGSVLERLNREGVIESYLAERQIEIIRPRAKATPRKVFKHLTLKSREWPTTSQVPVPSGF